MAARVDPVPDMPMEGPMRSLYEQDFIGWTEQQARVLRDAAAQGSNLSLDWANLIEEVESLGRSERRALGSEVKRIIQHLLKLEFSPAMEPRANWVTTVDNARDEIEALLVSDPGLKPRLADIIGEAAPRAAKSAARELSKRGEIEAARRAAVQGADHYAEAQILGDWFPGEGDD
jgi:hypothetical protein